MEYPDSISLLQQVSGKHLYNKLLKQLEKDMLLANTPVEVPAGISPEDLIVMLREKIYLLILEDFPAYPNLLYVADIAETEIVELEGSDAVEMADSVCFMLLKRIWKKVWYKENLS